MVSNFFNTCCLKEHAEVELRACVAQIMTFAQT